MSKKFVLGLIISLVAAVLAAGGIITAAVLHRGETDLRGALGGAIVNKMTMHGEDMVIGTREGEIKAYSADGELIFDLGVLGEGGESFNQQVLELVSDDDDIYVVYQSDVTLKFSFEDATGWYEGGHAQAFDGLEVRRTEYKINGGVSSTQLIVDGDTYYVRADYYVGGNDSRIYRFDGEDEAELVARAVSGGISGMTMTDDGLCYTERSAVKNEDGQRLYSADETLLALSCEDDKLYALSAKNIYEIDVSGAASVTAHGKTFATGFVFTTGRNFLAKKQNGGVVMIDAARGKITLEMSAGTDANPIMWSDDGFVLCDSTDVNNPVITYYSLSAARRKTASAVLFWVFIPLLVAAILCSLYFGFGLKPAYRSSVNAVLRRALIDIWKNKSIYLYLIIPFALLVTFYYVPIVLGLGISFFDYIPGVRAKFISFDNFVKVCSNTVFWKSARTMLIFLVADLLKALIPPLFFAEAILAVKYKRFSFWTRILLFIPGIMPGLATVLVWQEGIFGTSGLVNQFVQLFAPSFTRNWITQAKYAMPAIIVFGFPWIGSYLIFYGALMGIDKSVFEAAKLDGCGWLGRIIRLDIPLIVPQIKYVFITSFIASAQNYGTLYILYGVGETTVLNTPALLMYSEIMNAHYGVASAMGVLLFIFLSIATVLNFRAQREQL